VDQHLLARIAAVPAAGFEHKPGGVEITRVERLEHDVFSEIENLLLGFRNRLPQARAVLDPLMDGLPSDPHASGSFQGLAAAACIPPCERSAASIWASVKRRLAGIARATVNFVKVSIVTKLGEA
jgi:hypothetical protein